MEIKFDLRHRVTKFTYYSSRGYTRDGNFVLNWTSRSEGGRGRGSRAGGVGVLRWGGRRKWKFPTPRLPPSLRENRVVRSQQILTHDFKRLTIFTSVT